MKMKLKTMTVFFAMLLGIAVMSIGTEQACAMGGDGTADNPYQISTYRDLKKFAQIVNDGKTTACAKLTADIDAKGDSDWIPIGNDLDPGDFYRGTFDGQGHTITGLRAYSYSEPVVGLFGGSSGVIKNVGIVNNNFRNNYNIIMPYQGTGGVVGYNEGTVENCYNASNVSGEEGVGGVVGKNHGTISNCYNTGDVSGRRCVGGVVGRNYGTISNCYNTGDVSGDYSVGGVVGYIHSGTISNCYNTGAVRGEDEVGGVVGNMGEEDTASNCYNTGKVSGDNFVGGVIGWNNYGTVNNCYYDSDLLTGVSPIGQNYDRGTVTNVEGLPTDEMTGPGALDYMAFDDGDGENPWQTKEDEPYYWFYPHLKGFQYDTTKNPDDWPAKTDVGTVATPTFSPEAGEFDSQQTITISCTTKDATIYYTTDGSALTTSSNEYTEPITINETTTIRAMAVKDRMFDSESASATYTRVHTWSEEWSKDGANHWHVCTACGEKKDEAAHTWDAGKVTKAATEKATGTKTFTCTVCKATKTETIPKLKPSAPKVSGTPTAKMTAKGTNSLNISWNKIQGAAGYDIFFAECNHSGKKIACKNVKNIKGNKTFTWTKSGLKKKTPYKAYIKAYVMKNGKKSYVRTSPMMHAYTGGQTKNYTNAKSVTVNKTSVTLKKGKTYTIKATVNKVNKKKKLMPKSHAATLRYMTSNSKIATVNSSGKVTAKGKGTCYIYAFAHNGVSKQVKITVK